MMKRRKIFMKDVVISHGCRPLLSSSISNHTSGLQVEHLISLLSLLVWRFHMLIYLNHTLKLRMFLVKSGWVTRQFMFPSLIVHCFWANMPTRAIVLNVGHQDVSKEQSADARWHKEKRIAEANVMRHPADGEAWEHFDSEFSCFAKDARNMKLGIATDGFNPFGNMTSSYQEEMPLTTSTVKDIDQLLDTR
uniref:Uncharacterized protein n=1 Tax=Aegilops tauschii subsp. strangulata TaxID=200361 RepID=A0A453GNK9_AEGTS